MTGEDEPLVGREAELDRLRAFLGRRHGLPAGLVIEGSAGAGKTTLWRAGVDHASAAGFAVLSCRPAGAEVQLSLAALSDLLDGRLAAVPPTLPPPQRRALEVALLLRDDQGNSPDQRALFAGVLNTLRALAREAPVLIAIDDAQWVDPPSAEVIDFALRRLRDAPVAVLASWRTGSATTATTATAPTGKPGHGLRIDRSMDRATETIVLGPLSLGALHRLLRTRTNLAFNRRTLERIHETSGGNPFYALELARAMERDPRPGEPLPLSAGLSELLADRLTGFEQPTRSALFVAAAASEPTVGLLESVLATPDGSDGDAGMPVRDPRAVRDALQPAIDASIVRLDADVIEFTHPLLAAAAYALPDADSRRRWHARLADAMTAPEARARHLALARTGADPDVARALHAAALDARQRGAPGAAAELFLSAIDRLPADARLERATWAVEAAPVIRSTGGAARSRPILERSASELDAGPIRSDVLLQLASVVEDDPNGGGRELELIEQALREAGDDPHRRAAALLDREMLERSQDRLASALVFAKQALALAEQADDIDLLTVAHIRTADLDVLTGFEGDPVARFARALELDARDRPRTEPSASSMLAACLIRKGRLDDARPLLLEQRARTIAEGDELSHQLMCLFLTELEWLAGRWDEAAAFAQEGLEVAEQAGARMRQGAMLGMLGLVEASRGEPDRARSLAQTGLALCEEVGEVAYANYARQVLGFLDLSLGNAAAAHEQLDTYSVEQGIEGTKRITFMGGVVGSRVPSVPLPEADALAREIRHRGATLHRPMLDAVAARSRALVLGARGELDEAVAAATEAVDAYAALGMPFERARSLIVLGEIQRRAKQRRVARETLTNAIEAFDRLGASRWSARASAERARVGGRSTIEGLSATELRVAQLVADGLSNKEIAAELFVTVRAVESNLSKVYAKLGIRSRTEIARRI